MALEIGTRTLPRYGHRFSRQDFTLPQLFTILVLRKFFKTDSRVRRRLTQTHALEDGEAVARRRRRLRL